MKTWIVTIKAQDPMSGAWDNWKYEIEAEKRDEAKRIARAQCGLMSIAKVSASIKR